MEKRDVETNRIHWFSLLLILFIAASTVLIFQSVKQTMAVTGSFTSCPSGFSLSVGGNTTSGTTQIITGMTNVLFGTGGTTASTVNKVVILVNGAPIGKTMPASGGYSWNMPWVTSLTPNGQVYVQAEVTTTDGGVCRTNPITVMIQNPVASNITIVAQPQSWQGPLSFSFPINSTVYVPEQSFNATSFVLFEYNTSIGSILGSGPSVQYSSGKTAGSGAVTIFATYGGKKVQVNIPVKVGSSTAPIPVPTATASSPVSTTNNQTVSSGSTQTALNTANTATATTSTQPTNIATTQAAAVARTATLASNTPAQDCAVTAIGKDKFVAINSGSVRPTSDEVKKLSICFATSNYILPSNFAPVAPKELSKLQDSSNLAIAKIANEKITVANENRESLKISGKSKPNSIVVLYVFSEPLVLTTTADSDGNWSYSLQDPIEQGKHEVYAVVDRGDGVYQKSSPLDFVIGTATAAADNPEGLSLVLADTITPAQSNRSTLFYAIGSILLVLIVSLAALIILIKRHKRPPTPPTDPTNTSTTPPQSTPTTPTMFTPTQS